MPRPLRRTATVLLLTLALLNQVGGCTTPPVRTDFERLPVTVESWLQPFPPVQIAGNFYYVGGYELAAYLIATPDGHILINSGVYDSSALIQASVEALGFEFEDIEILLTTQAHWDHVADLAAIKRMTGARLLAHQGDVAVLEDGGASDFRSLEEHTSVFESVMVDQVLQHGDLIELGGTILTLHHHPGHTKGSSSFSLLVQDNGVQYPVLIVNMASVNAGVTLLDMPAYPRIRDDYEATLAAQKALAPEIWVSSHASQFDLHDKYSPGDSYDPTRFVDPDGYRAKIESYERRYLARLQEEQARSTQP